jgi:hypothetical protein
MVRVVFGYFYLAFAISFLTCKAIVQSDRFKSFLLEFRNNAEMHWSRSRRCQAERGAGAPGGPFARCILNKKSANFRIGQYLS